MSSFPPYSLILTHPGGAHKDEFIACAILLAISPAPVVRREPTEDDLENPATVVIDVGHRHEPELNNFDHHQLPRDHTPTCSISLVLQQLGLYADAREFCDWLEPAEWFDCRGPNDTARWLGVDRETLNKLHSPVDGTILRQFARSTRLEIGSILWQIMRLIGDDLLTYLRELRARLDSIARQAELWPLDPAHPNGPAILFIARTEPLEDDPSAGLDRYITHAGLVERVVATVTPDRRSAGYGLTRFRDHPGLDFTRVAGEPDVHFTHKGGFVAKTNATDPARLHALVRQAFLPA